MITVDDLPKVTEAELETLIAKWRKNGSSKAANDLRQLIQEKNNERSVIVMKETVSLKINRVLRNKITRYLTLILIVLELLLFGTGVTKAIPGIALSLAFFIAVIRISIDKWSYGFGVLLPLLTMAVGLTLTLLGQWGTAIVDAHNITMGAIGLEITGAGIIGIIVFIRKRSHKGLPLVLGTLVMGLACFGYYEQLHGLYSFVEGVKALAFGLGISIISAGMVVVMLGELIEL